MIENWDTLSFLIGLITGGISVTLVSISIKKNMRSSGDGDVVDQSKARAGGDIVGRDKK